MTNLRDLKHISNVVLHVLKTFGRLCAKSFTDLYVYFMRKSKYFLHKKEYIHDKRSLIRIIQ